MGKETDVLKPLEESSVSRRSFLKGTAALGAMAAMYGLSLFINILRQNISFFIKFCCFLIIK